MKRSHRTSSDLFKLVIQIYAHYLEYRKKIGSLCWLYDPIHDELCIEAHVLNISRLFLTLNWLLIYTELNSYYFLLVLGNFPLVSLSQYKVGVRAALRDENVLVLSVLWLIFREENKEGGKSLSIFLVQWKAYRYTKKYILYVLECMLFSRLSYFLK